MRFHQLRGGLGLRLGAALTALALLAGCDGEEDEAPAEIRPVRTVTVEESANERVVSSPGGSRARRWSISPSASAAG